MSKKISWVRLMWQNNYIQLFIAAIILFVIVLIGHNEFYSKRGLYVSLGIPVLMMVGIGYFGFYKYWKQIKNEKREEKRA